MSRLKIYLHIGEPKCASSSVQELFRRHAADFRKFNIVYPLDVVQDEVHIGSGNVHNTGDFAEREFFSRIQKLTHDHPGCNLLFSSEHLFSYCAEGGVPSLIQHIESLGYEAHIIWLTRDIIPTTISGILQLHKRHGDALSLIKDFPNRAKNWMQLRIRLLDALVPDVPFSIINISKKQDVLRAVLSVMNIELETIAEIPKMNRAITAAEYALLSGLRKFNDESKDVFFTRTLCFKLVLVETNSAPLKITLSPTQLNEVALETNPLIEQFNRRIPEEHRLNPIDTEPAEVNDQKDLTERLSFTDEEAQLIHDLIHKEFEARIQEIRQKPLLKIAAERALRRWQNLKNKFSR